MLAADGLLPVAAIFMLTVLVGSVIGQQSWAFLVPETLCTLLVSIILGLIIRGMIMRRLLSMESFELVDEGILNLILLPIIIFNGGWSLNLPHFYSQFTYVLVFAVGGTLITMMFIGYSGWLLANAFGIEPLLRLRTCFAFAALISATDPVATLITFDKLDVARKQPLLNVLVLGESLINDAVAIVFFNGLNFHQSTILGIEMSITARMFTLLFGSIVFGTVVASGLIVLMRFARLPGNTVLEILYMFVAPYFIFTLTEAVGLSGIIAVLFGGIVYRTYGSMHFNAQGKLLATRFLEIVSRFADNGVFILCGTSVALMNSVDGFQFGIVAVVLCLIGRGIATLFCSGLTNLIKKLRTKRACYIRFGHGVMIWLSGLRGGIALLLALELDPSWCGEEAKALIVNITFMVICILLLVCGGSAELALLRLGLVKENGGTAESSESDDDSASSSLKDLHDIGRDGSSDMMVLKVGDYLDDVMRFLLVGETVEAKRKGEAPIQTSPRESGMHVRF